MVRIFKNGKLTTPKSGAQYDGEKIPGDLDSWDVLSTDSNYILESTYGELSKRSMTLYHQHPLARSAVNKQVEYAVGPGTHFRSQPDWSILGQTKEWAKDWGKDFQKIVHFYYQMFNFYEKQGILMRGGLTAGDSLLSFQRDDKGYLSDLIELSGDQIDWSKMDKNYYLGIKHDKLLRKLGIWMATGDAVPFQDENGDQNIIQFMIKELPRQLRGYPLVYSVINHAKQDDRHTDATVQRAVMEATQFATFEGNQTDFKKQIDNLAKRALEEKKGGKVSALSKLWGSRKQMPGTVYSLGAGEKYDLTDLKTPSDNYRDFKDVNCEYFGAATGTPPEVILSKYSTSYTAHRGALNDFEKSFMAKRGTIYRNVIYPTNREILKDAILQGFIKAPGFFDGTWMIQRAYLQGNILGPIPGAINPIQEITAKLKAVDGGVMLRSDVAATNGNEWDNFITEWQEEQNEYFNGTPESRAQSIQNNEMGKTGGDK